MIHRHIPSTDEDASLSYNIAFQAGFEACAQMMGSSLRGARDTSDFFEGPLDVLGAVSGFEEYLVATKGYKPSGVTNARSILKKFAVHIGSEALLSPHTAGKAVESFIITFIHPAYRYTATHYLRLFFDFLRWEVNPARSIPLPKINRAQGRHFLSRAECQAIEDYFQKRPTKQRREHVLFLLLLYTGLRIGEALALRWEDISADGAVFIRDSKNNQARFVYIPKQVMDLLQQYEDGQARTPYVFPGRRPLKPLSYGVVRVAFKNILKKVGIDRSGCNWHSLRHTFSRACVESGMPRELLQQFLGHQDIRTTEIYTRLLSEDVRRQSPLAHKAVDNFLAPRAPLFPKKAVRSPK